MKCLWLAWLAIQQKGTSHTYTLCHNIISIGSTIERESKGLIRVKCKYFRIYTAIILPFFWGKAMNKKCWICIYLTRRVKKPPYLLYKLYRYQYSSISKSTNMNTFHYVTRENCIFLVTQHMIKRRNEGKNRVLFEAADTFF